MLDRRTEQICSFIVYIFGAMDTAQQNIICINRMIAVQQQQHNVSSGGLHVFLYDFLSWHADDKLLFCNNRTAITNVFINNISTKMNARSVYTIYSCPKDCRKNIRTQRIYISFWIISHLNRSQNVWKYILKAHWCTANCICHQCTPTTFSDRIIGFHVAPPCISAPYVFDIIV